MVNDEKLPVTQFLTSKMATRVLRKQFDDLSIISNLCTMSEFHAEAEAIAKAMQFIDKAARQLIERQEVE